MHPPLGLARDRDYADTVSNFQWRIPERYNSVAATVDRWTAEAPDRISLIREDADGRHTTADTRTLQEEANCIRYRISEHAPPGYDLEEER